jgi:hypothetical protein
MKSAMTADAGAVEDVVEDDVVEDDAVDDE